MNKERSHKSLEEPDKIQGKIESIIVNDDVDILLELAKKIGKELASAKLSKGQFRNLFDSIKRIEMEGEFSRRKLVLLKPKMEHVVSRVSKEKKESMQNLRDVLSVAIDSVGSDAKRFERFVEFFEAILCYHEANT